MFIGRTTERRTLEDIFATDRSNLVILYGRAGIGKTALIAEFLKEKNAYYYLLRESSFREQMLCMSEELESAYPGQPLKAAEELAQHPDAHVNRLARQIVTAVESLEE